MNSDQKDTVLLMLDLRVGYEAPVTEIMSRFPDAAFTIIFDSCAPASVVDKFRDQEIIHFQSSMSLPDKLRLLRNLWNRKFLRAFFIGGSYDMRQVGVIWSSFAAERKIIRVENKGRSYREKDIRLFGLLSIGFYRTLIFFLFLPFLLALRIFFAWEKYIKPARKNTPPRFPPLSSSPAVSVVIPNYNGRNLLEECLPSVIRAVSLYGRDSEIILVDDASTDESVALVAEKFPSVKIIALARNHGFGQASNLGIEKAAHDLVLLLNSDIAATDTFLFPLVRCFKDPDLFAVQPRAYYPGGKRLNVGMNVGRLDWASGYIQIWNEADTKETKLIDRLSPTLYCLGGAMLFDRRKYYDLGGFDKLFYPFRWEDIDICYRALKRGWKLLYQPESVVYHQHHATLNKVFTPDYLNIIEQKNELLFTWKNLHDSPLIDAHLRKLPLYLLSHLISGRYNFSLGLLRALASLPHCLGRRRIERIRSTKKDGQVLSKSLRIYRNFLRGDDKLGKGRKRQLLILNPVFPYPPVDGGKTRVYNLLQEASRTNDIHLLCYIEEEQKQYLPRLRKICRYVDTVDMPVKTAGFLGVFQEPLYPMYYRRFYTDEFRDRLIEILRSRPLDVVQMDFDKMLYWVNFTRKLPSVYIEHDVASILLSGGKNPPHSGWRRIIDLLEWMRALRWEVVMGRQYDRIVTLSSRDKDILKGLLPGMEISAGKTGTSLKHFFSPYQRIDTPSLLYIGSFIHYPNVEAILYFKEMIWPLIKEKIPGVTLTIVGSHPTSEVKALDKDSSIEVTGFVEDVRTYLDRSAVFIAPMRKGFGMKGKVLEALARAKPVVTTSNGMGGMLVIPGRHLLIGDTPEDFAAAVIRFLNDDSLCGEIARAGQDLIRNEYDWGKIAGDLDEIYKEMLDEGIGAEEYVRLVREVMNEEEAVSTLPVRPGPVKELSLELTYRCNQKCVMCDIWERTLNNPDLVKEELKLNEIKEMVLGSAYLKNPEVVVLSGGEPFLRADLAEICGFFLKNFSEVKVGILTNGFQTRLILKTLREVEDRWGTSRLWLGSSLDGIGDTHDRIRGCPGAFGSLNRSLTMIKKEFPALPVSLNFTLTPINYRDLLPAFHFARNRGADFSAQFPIPWEGTTTFSWQKEELEELERSIYAVIQYLIDDEELSQGKEGLLKNRGLFSRTYYWQGLIEYGKNPRRLFPNCMVVWDSATISPGGDLYLCPYFKNQTLGNIREKSFDEIWDSGAAAEFRQRVSLGKCHCWLNCIVYSLADDAFDSHLKKQEAKP